MKNGSYSDDLVFTDERVRVSLILETSFSKEIRIAFKKGQEMKEHQAGFPIVVHLLKGAIEFGTGGNKYQLKEGDILTLDAKVPHDLIALEESVVRLTLSKGDTVDRVEKVSKDSER